ncbi:MAG: hypothetical protein WC545_02580 [Patescibacteria group bacterium]
MEKAGFQTETKDGSRENDQYAALGVDADKTSVRQAFKPIIDNDYPRAFVNIVKNPFGQGVLTQHQDGDGSKSVQRLLHYLITGDRKQLGYMVDDALSMNASDISASGFVFGPWVISQVLNANLETLEEGLKGIVMQEISRRWAEIRKFYEDNGFKIKFLGGETADLPDQVRSSVFDMTITAQAEESDIIKGEVKPGDRIWGLASDGQAAWEKEWNSGIMANGLTLARSVLMGKNYNLIFLNLNLRGDYYRGRFQINDKPSILNGLTVSEALLSPTRPWAIIIRKILERLKWNNRLHMLHGISINTGGGATKIKHVGQGIIYDKTMPIPPPIFLLIQQESKELWENMFRSFNCGIGVDLVGEDDPVFERIIFDAAYECGIVLNSLGRCFRSGEEKNKVMLRTPYGTFKY